MVTPLTALYWVPDIPPSPSFPTHTLSSNSSTLPPATASLLTSVPSLSTSPAEVDGGGLFQSTENSSDAVSTTTTAPVPQGRGTELLKSYEFWLLFLCLLVQYCGHTTVITMQETVCFQLLGEERHKYGQQRLWGTVGVGLSAIISGALVDLYSKGMGQKDYLPAHILTAVFLVVDLFVVAFLKFPHPERKISSAALQGALWRPHVVLVLVTTGVVGVVSGVLWTFEFLLVVDVAGKGFVHQKLLLGLLTGVQCFLAEVPFFVLAGRIIQRLGHANALFVSLLGFTLRLILYSVVTNPWVFLPIDLLHGISFGVAYPCFTSYASSVAPKGAAATTQAIFGAMFFGSTGVGGFVGGQLFKAVGGAKTFLLMGAATGVYALMFSLAHLILARLTRSSLETIGGLNAESRREDAKKDTKEKGEEAEVMLEGGQKNGGKEMVMGVSFRQTDERN
ncbi:major facilitator superfamily domain-containing protein 6-A-like isoform X2 [Portunus trituberculatus]|nr:major facilitator superfamily domain-containing protein 6-A-like isoform X2 [Portunus trituberculatus]